MKSIQKNYPILIGWFAYFISAILLSITLSRGFLYSSLDFSFKSTNFIFSFAIYVFIDYLRFLISAQWIALPIYKSMKNITGKSKQGFLFFEWLHYNFWIFLCIFPVENYSYLFPVSREVQAAIVAVWSIVITFWAYHGVVTDYVVKLAKINENNLQEVVV